MLRKILSSLTRIWNKWSYILISGSLAIAIIVSNTHPLRSQIVSSSEAVSPPKEELVDLEKFSDMVAKLEAKWESDYEGYFDRNFSNRSRSAKQIAKHLKEIQEQINIRPAVIWAVPKDDFLQLILITPEQQFVTKKVRGADRERLTSMVERLETGIADRRSLKYLPPARLIHRWLFKPLEPYLEAEQIDTLLLCTGPTLRSLPFAALHDGEQFVIEKYNLARIPAFNLTDTSYKPKPEKKVLAMGASEFKDLPSLPGVEVELETIVPKLWSGRKILNQDFTVQNLKNAHQQGGFDIIHIASHSKFKSGSPEDSYIQFGDRKMSLDQIASLELELPPVDLLVLSACETALGDHDAEFGFAGLAMQAGVKSALASLWAINDSGTVVLMSEFYQKLKSIPVKAEALRQAQISMLKKKVYVEENKVKGSAVEVNLPASTIETQSENFDHPFYWAGFTIIGNPW
ncbi:CHAT domain-containing protein [Pleurocapsa sp. PCC 7319]|uniref:CHAT domain-containing protein n=1 Tax=Pleurocapsa sp. PCC 7319 TaxID=118161 RepID=UPI0009FE5A88|nr:CHAT domain-containing protein [Pleurocapsa sp. PCC 7319]